jgi:hypothetical protein
MKVMNDSKFAPAETSRRARSIQSSGIDPLTETPGS